MTSPSAREQLLLWGFMGAGKSTVGRLVAARRSLPFFALDACIEEREGITISELFARRGEAGFRAVEARALFALLETPRPRVVALGGGSLLSDEARRRALSEAFVVVLEISAETALARTAGSDRPLLKGRAELERLFEARQAAYAEAHERLDAAARPEWIARAIEGLWKLPDAPA
jgi:shikimate kinase / 3-dehydroquinate synthase